MYLYMTIDFIISTFFLLLTLVIVLRCLYLLAKNYKKFLFGNYYNEITLLTGLTIAISSHQLIKQSYAKTYGFNPINLL